ncbi:MAG: c-type cytochrome, partial [Saprospiraceae bacterium]|nr:c-type cytochrome [Saprospiraceae bacterium]
PNGLWRGMDNWYYNAKSDTRFQWTNGIWTKDQTEFRGQWGICHDDAGRLYYNYNWSQLHADLVPPNYLSANPHHRPSSGIDHGLTLDRRIYPIRSNPAANRGYLPGTLDDKQRLVEFTSACSPFVYRGDLLPGDFLGNVFVCEPTANLIRRNIVLEEGVLLSAYNAYQNQEFLASTDERFRPVALISGPDGALYVADMYRGIIQHGLYMSAYLREMILARKLDQHINLGRIWRILPADGQSEPVRPLSFATVAELVDILGHPNGWYRDLAQRLLVERQDTSTVPLLFRKVQSARSSLGRLHALWTLQGLGNQLPSIYFQALEDSDPMVQATAIRLLEPLAMSDPAIKGQLAQVMEAMASDASQQVQLQIALTARVLPALESIGILTTIVNHFHDSPLMRDAVLSSLYDREHSMLEHLLTQMFWESQSASQEIFLELLGTAIANKGEASELARIMDQLVTDQRGISWQYRAVLRGLAHHSRGNDPPIALRVKPSIMTVLEAYDEAIRSDLEVLLQMLTWPGHKPAQGKLLSEKEEQEIDRELLSLGRQQYLAVCASCHGTEGTGIRRFGPPLVNSDWVYGDEKKLILIMLHGMQGPVKVNGIRYDVPEIQPVMPSLSVIQNREIAAILSYIRQAWGHRATPVTARSVGRIRVLSQGKVTPWTAEELMQLPAERVNQDNE